MHRNPGCATLLSMETLHNAPFSKRKALIAVLLAPLWGLALVLFLPVVGMLLTVYTLLTLCVDKLILLRRKLRVIDA